MRFGFVLILAGVVLAQLFDNEAIISAVNKNANAAWRAGYNPRTSTLTVDEMKAMLRSKNDLTGVADDSESMKKLTVPDAYDARAAYPNCNFHVLDQGQCGSCWAFACAEALSDRYCIKSNGTVNVDLSPQTLVSCDWEGNQGCNGGIPRLAWDYLEFAGLPTLSCVPYTSGKGERGSCSKKCVNGEPYVARKVKFYSVKAYRGEKAIMGAIFADGPVETGFTVYEDFMSYRSGVYHHVTGSMLGGHAVKIIGWGEEAGTKYWLVQNSWGTGWGLKGLFKIKRGNNECGFEDGAVAGQPAL